MAKDGQDTQETLLYLKFIEIRDWCQLKSKIPVIRVVISFGYRKINCLQSLSWWIMDMSLRGEIIDLNNFNSDIIFDSIECYTYQSELPS